MFCIYFIKQYVSLNAILMMARTLHSKILIRSDTIDVHRFIYQFRRNGKHFKIAREPLHTK